MFGWYDHPCWSYSKHYIYIYLHTHTHTHLYIYTRIPRSRYKRIKNIEHVLPGINNIQKAKCRERAGKVFHANLMGVEAWPLWFRRNSHTARTGPRTSRPAPTCVRRPYIMSIMLCALLAPWPMVVSQRALASVCVIWIYVFAAGRRRVIVRRPRPNLSGPPPALNTRPLLSVSICAAISIWPWWARESITCTYILYSNNM